MNLNGFESFFVDETCVDSSLFQRLKSFVPQEKIQIVSQSPENQFSSGRAQDFARGKKNLWITKHKGEFFKRCPGSSQKKALACCNYFILNLGSQCHFDCSYCYLQSYLSNPLLRLYANVEDAIAELRANRATHSGLPVRVGTGEIVDSLALDPLTLNSRILIQAFRDWPDWTLEFKTKSDEVDQFLDLGPSPNVVVSWSLNSEFICRTEEHGTASLEQRLTAAEKCVKAGFKVAFHLDPLIFYPEWREGYADLVDRLTKKFSPQDVNVISLGSLRFQAEQKHSMRLRFGLQSSIFQSPMYASASGKLRYDQNLRSRMFTFVHDRFKNHNSAWKIFLCMETPETWIRSLQTLPNKTEPLKEFFRPLPKLQNNADHVPQNC